MFFLCQIFEVLFEMLFELENSNLWRCSNSDDHRKYSCMKEQKMPF